MDEEDIDDLLAEQKHVADSLGMVNFDHFLEFRVDAAYGLCKFGSEFEVCLGSTLLAADIKDSVKIIRVWQSICYEYSMLYKIHKAREDALK